MKRGLTIIVLIALLTAAVPASGQSKRQLEQDKAKIEKEISRLNRELGKAKKSTKQSARQIGLLNKRLKERTKLIDNINSQMQLIDRRIARTEDSLRTMRLQIDSMKSEYARVVRTLYGLRFRMNKEGLLFDNENYNRDYLKLKYFNEYSRYRRHQSATIQRKEKIFEQTSLDLQRQMSEKNSLLAQHNKQKAALSREQQREQQNLDRSRQQERDLKNLISRNEKQKQLLQQKINELIQREVAKSGGAKPQGDDGVPVYTDRASNDFAENKGRLSWPVYYKSVTREFGRYTHSSGGQNMNYGIDLACTPGATVMAVFGGTVASVFATPSGTKGIILRHGAYLTVYAGLGSVAVAKDSKVSARQPIGTVATSDQPLSEFSFQVWCGKDPLNPRKWLR